MENQKVHSINKQYIISVLALTFVVPIVCFVWEVLAERSAVISIEMAGKWFIFSAVGLRLFAAGIKQTTNPAFTAKEIFQIDSADSLPIVRELGFANLCFGLTGIISLFMPQWRIASAFGSGLYYGIAGLQHLLKKPVGGNELFALITDIIIFIVLVVYFIKMV